jgi:hypothetical protein
MPEIEFKEIKQLIENLCHDKYNREILRFFARHPYAHFDKKILSESLGLNDSCHIKTILEELAKQHLLEIKTGYGAHLYWLTRCEPAHSAVKSVFSSPSQKAGDAADRLSVMQLAMPLTLCSV